MPAKLKSRDLLPGWPRGKSCSQPRVPEPADSGWWLVIARMTWPPYEIEERKQELQYAARYHAAQQEDYESAKGYRSLRIYNSEHEVGRLLVNLWYLGRR